MARSWGRVPKGATDVRGVTSVKTPSLAMVNKEMSFSLRPGFATYRNFPEG
jgi:hypothetical protein